MEGGGVGYSSEFYTGRLRPKIQPLTLYIVKPVLAVDHPRGMAK